MPAAKEVSINLYGTTLGIVAGGGDIPARLIAACVSQNINFKIIGFKNFTDPAIQPDYWITLGQTGRAIKWLQDQSVKDVVMIGHIERPKWRDLYCHWPTIKLLFKAWRKSWGDSNLLSAAREVLEDMAFHIHGVHQFLPELLMPAGYLTQEESISKEDVVAGLKASQELGIQDIGQAVLVKNGDIIARETSKGTSAMIKAHGCAGAVLVKTCKPQQDMDLDLPTIGLNTVRICAEKRVSGIVAHAGKSLFVDREEAVKLANEKNISIFGASLKDVA